MKIGFCGMGKLGFPCALSAAKAHDVVGYDALPHAKAILASRKYPHREVKAQEYLESTTLRIVDTTEALVAHADVILVAVQTPHGPQYEGLTRMPETRADFDYAMLRESVKSIADEAKRQKKHVALVAISTVLPGTSERELYQLLNEYTHYCYTPYFIAMGTTIPDFEKPEFTLLGVREGENEYTDKVRQFYNEVSPREIRTMGVASAELTKVAYNVFLGLKIVAANAIMEIAHKTGANCDDVTNALGKATDRIVSSKYMRGGMGDGGGCHPRDQIALSWLAQELCLSYDLFDAMVQAREMQTEWLSDLCLEASKEGALGIVVLGKAYKKGTNLTFGSPAILLKNLLDEFDAASVDQWDPHVDGDEVRIFDKPTVFIIATDHDEFFDDSMVYPKGSTIIDPWGKMKDREGIKVVRVGRK